ncbi:MAG: DUF1501 domain-containing protein [Alphaproteobacteria bacterium]|nr:DUF1501 domain-containing protein [Alphaproteobacteria bacterium]
MTRAHLPAFGRRALLLGLGASIALPGVRLAFAQAPGPARLVVVLLRGGLDGLYAVQPYAELNFAELRGPLALPEPSHEDGLLDLGGRFGLHPRLSGIHAMFRENQALILHAVAGPWRTRSHFDAQDLLESGADQRLASGWLNRALTALPQTAAGRAAGLAVGTTTPLLLRGGVRVDNYMPRGVAEVPPDLMARILDLNARDQALGLVLRDGIEARGYVLETLGEAARQRPSPGGQFAMLAKAAGQLMAAPQGPSVAAFELGGWDTHAQQLARLNAPLAQMDEGLVALKQALGDVWRRTAVLVVTEFGRTARVNGTLGTDHGTGGAAFVLGGAVQGGRMLGDWPGLAPANLFQNRDLWPTTDMRSLAKGLLRDHLRLGMAAVDAAFPGSGEAAPLGGLVRG